MSTLSKKVVCINLKKKCLGTSFVDASLTASLEQSTGAEEGKVKGSKKILGKSLKPLQALIRQAGEIAKEISLPGISDDLRIITPSRLLELQGHIVEIEQKIAEEVAKFSDTVICDGQEMTYYEALKHQDKEGLKAAYDPYDYPPIENLGLFFTLRLTVCDLPQGDYFRVEGLTEDAISKMKADHAKMIEAVSANAKNEVNKKLCELIGKVAERMSDPDSKIYDTLFTNLQDYADKIPDLNITNDPQLEAMRVAVKETLNLNANQARASRTLKAQAATAAKDILAKFGGGNRKILMAAPINEDADESEVMELEAATA